jgi:hypothetical protein
MGPVAAVIGAVATVGGTIMAYSAQKKAAKAAQRQQELSTQRSNRQSIREAQLKRAQAIAAGASMGALGGSALAGGLGSLGAQLGSGLGFSSQMSSLSADINKYSQKAETWGAVASMGGSLFQAAGGFDAFGNKSDTANKAPTATPRYNPNRTPMTYSYGGGR